MTQISSAHQSTRHSITLSRESNHEGSQAHPSITRGVPLLYACSPLLQIYYGLIRGPGNIVLQYLNYVSVVLIWLLAFYAVRSWIKTVDRQAKLTVIALLLFLALFPIGIFMAHDVPSVRTVRNVIVSTCTFACYVLILLVAPPNLHQLRRRSELVIIATSILGAAYLIYDFWQLQQSGEAATRQAGLYGQSSVSSPWLSVGVGLLLYRRDTIRLPRPVLLALAAAVSMTNLLTASFLGLLLTGMFWTAYVFDEIRNPVLRGTLLSFLLCGLGVWGMLVTTGDEAVSGQVLNNRVTAIINTIKSGNIGYMDSVSTFKLRWNSTVNGIKEIPRYSFRGKGMLQDQVTVRYEQGGQLVVRNIDVFGNVVGIWLGAGALAGVSYAWFIWRLVRLLWLRFQKMEKGAWAVVSVLSLVLTVGSVTGAFDATLAPVLVAWLCCSTGSASAKV